MGAGSQSRVESLKGLHRDLQAEGVTSPQGRGGIWRPPGARACPFKGPVSGPLWPRRPDVRSRPAPKPPVSCGAARRHLSYCGGGLGASAPSRLWSPRRRVVPAWFPAAHQGEERGLRGWGGVGGRRLPCARARGAFSG